MAEASSLITNYDPSMETWPTCISILVGEDETFTSENFCDLMMPKVKIYGYYTTDSYDTNHAILRWFKTCGY